MNGIEIVTGSRLHFGLICSRPATRWRFGGIGVMLRQPAWRLKVTPINADTDSIEATSIARLRIREFLHRIRSHQYVPSLQLQVSVETSFHNGLGRGTQLGLALSAAAELIAHRRLEEDPFQLARMADRAERSAVGTVGFLRGGFLIDRGAAADERCVPAGRRSYAQCRRRRPQRQRGLRAADDLLARRIAPTGALLPLRDGGSRGREHQRDSER